ncbi:MAG: hypothetical protein WA793_08830 [Sphingorhabdus sp.]|uniref:hypothetical protein n=1 Tax=Sphingorhabdus sp. TaxID=1902408 RepID=UPI003C883CDB
MPENSASKSIFLEVRFAVLRGTYGPGQVLDREELCQAYRCKSAVVVGALNVLVHEGYLDMPRRGVFGVRSWSPLEINDLFDIRATMMGMAASRAAERGTDLEASNLIRAFKTASPFDFSDADATERLISRCAGIQNMVVRMARVSTIADIARNMGPNALFRKSVWSQKPKQLNSMWNVLGHVCHAVADRNPNAAQASMSEFVEATRGPLLASQTKTQKDDAPEFPTIGRIDCSARINGCYFGAGDREIGLDGRIIPFGVLQSS